MDDTQPVPDAVVRPDPAPAAAGDVAMPQSDPIAVEPTNGAGLTPADPPQDDLSQDPNVVVVGDLDEMPEEV